MNDETMGTQEGSNPDQYSNDPPAIDTPNETSAAEEKEEPNTKAKHVDLCAKWLKSNQHWAIGPGQADELYLYYPRRGAWCPLGYSALRTLVCNWFDEYTPHVPNKATVETVMEYLKGTAVRMPAVPSCDFVNLRNGVYDVKAHKLRVHDPSFKTPHQLPVDFNPEAECPHWARFLALTFEEEAQFFYTLISWLMRPVTDYQYAVCLLSTGSNGKTVMLNGIRRFLGSENLANIDLPILESQFGQAGLLGKLVNLVDDINFQDVRSMVTFRRVTGSSVLRGEHKHERAFTFHNYCRMFMASNSHVIPKEAQDAVYRRIFYLRMRADFLVQTELHRPETEVLRELTSAEELSGLLNRALEMANAPFVLPPSSLEEAREILQENHAVAQWLSACAKIESGSRDIWTSRRDLYQSYKDWSKREKVPMPYTTSNLFIQGLRQLVTRLGQGVLNIDGKKRIGDTTENVVFGIRLLHEGEPVIQPMIQLPSRPSVQ